MKIGIIGTRGIPNQHGGFEQLAQHLSAGLAGKGHEVYVYNSSLHSYKEKMFGNVHLIHCKDWEHRIGTAGQFIYDLNCINDSRKRNFDILLHLGYTSDSVWHRRWPKQTVHLINMDGLEWKRNKYTAITRRFLKYAESLAARHADTLIADSPGIQQYLLNKFGKDSTFIPYGAVVFDNPDPTVLEKFNIQPFSYSLLIARMEPENNIEMIIKAHLNVSTKSPLLIIGNTSTKHGKYLTRKYKTENVKFLQAIYDAGVLNNIRYHTSLYFHGHSVGGTNPALLEAMGCGCRIVAHNNIFNKAVLGEDADYFSNEVEIAAIINTKQNSTLIDQRRSANLEKIRSVYNWQKIIDAYEAVMMNAAGCR